MKPVVLTESLFISRCKQKRGSSLDRISTNDSSLLPQKAYKSVVRMQVLECQNLLPK